MSARREVSEDQKLERAARLAVKKYLHKSYPTPRHAWRIISPHPLHNVVGVAIGRKRVKGKDTSTPCVRLFVRHKFVLPRKSKFALHKEIGGVPTDIIAVGTPRHTGNNNGGVIDLKRLRPARPGCWLTAQPLTDISYPTQGTLGAVLEDENGKLYLLSNNHVIAVEDQNSKGDAVYQPTTESGNKIATLFTVIQLNRDGPNTVDCALAKVISAKDVSGVPLDPVGPLTSTAPMEPQVGSKVEKMGATTGHTIGTVVSTNATFKVDGYDTAPDLLLEEQIQIENGDEDFCGHGDSGSLVVDVETKQAVGLLAVNMGGFALANRLSNVITALSTKLGSQLSLKI
jgi:hypothetical protein